MDFISDVNHAEMLFEQNFFFMLFITIIIIVSAEIKKACMLETAKIFFRQNKKL